MSWGYAASVVKVERQEQAGREAATGREAGREAGEVEQMPRLWLPQVASHFCGE